MASCRPSLWEHQRAACEFLWPLRTGGLFADMGTGKSRVAIELIMARKHDRILIVGPRKGMNIWPGEFIKHSDQSYTVVMLNGKLSERVELLRTPFRYPVAYVINYEALVYEDIQKALERISWDLIIIDEAQHIKSPSGKTSRFLARLGRKAEYRLAMTGTPAADSPMDVFGIYRFINSGIFGTKYADFRSRYAVIESALNHKTGQWYPKLKGYQNQEELSAKMYSIAFRVGSEVLDLPPQHDVQFPVILDDDTRVLYSKMERESVIDLNDGFAMSANAGVKVMRLQQITSGFTALESENPDNPRRTTTRISSEKLEALEEIFNQIPKDEPIVVFSRFTEDVREVHKVAKILCNRHSWEVSGQRDDLEKWQKATGGQVLSVQIGAGAEGIDLTRAAYVVYFSPDYSLTHYDQSRKRTHRPGQTRPVIYYHLVAENTVDEAIDYALATKRNVVDYVVDQLRQRVAQATGISF